MFRAIGVAVVFSVLAPTFVLLAYQSQTPEDKLPACCRRDGKHHCAMMEMSMWQAQETQFRSTPEPCPFRSQASSIGYVVSYLPATSAVHFSALQSHPAIHTQTSAAFRITRERTHYKRGPPSNYTS